MACAIEDAGFEVRDTLSWNFGSGFPKSHNIGKKLDDQKERCACPPDLRNVRNGLGTEESFSGGAQQDMRPEMQCGDDISGEQGENTRSTDSLRDLREANLQSTDKLETKQECVLQLFVPQQDICRSSSTIRKQRLGQEASGQGIKGRAQPCLEGRRDLSEATRKLREREIHSLPAASDFDGKAGRLRDGAPGSDGGMDWPSTNADGVRSSSGSQAAEQYEDQSGIMAVQSQSQERGAWPYCERCGKPIVPDGLGTALKPAMELIVLARKPLSERTVASNVLRWGTGALNIDGCRVEATDQDALAANWDRMQSTAQSTIATALAPKEQIYKKEGRWPANVILDSSDEVVSAFPESDHARGNIGDSKGGGGMYGHDLCTNDFGAGDEGSAARFFYQVKQDDPCANRLFYTSKADSDDRIGSKHPTVKPLDLMQYLVRLVTPKGGLVLDPFAGSGTTGEAAYREGMRAVLIECEAEYLKDIERRIELLMSGPDERAFKSQKARQNGKPMDAGPLFGGKSDWDEMWTRPFERPELL
jgi:hypothetical protein